MLGKNVRYLRKKREMSQEELAARLGYKSYTTIQKWESGVAEPPVKVARQLADLFGVSLQALSTEDIEARELAAAAGTKQEYYLDPETARMAQELLDSPGQRTLLDATRDLSPDNMAILIQMAKALRDGNR